MTLPENPAWGGLTRRELLKVGALGVAGGALTLSGLARMAADANQADAAVGIASRGARLADPRELALIPRARGVREGSLVVAESDVPLAGTSAHLSAYNGRVPGPLVRVRSGDKMRLRVTNDLVPGGANGLGVQRGATNLHTHGWHVSPSDPADNTMRSLEPGDSWTYEYDLTHQPAGSMGWYHPHVHGLVAEQLWAGLAGPLVVDDPDDTLGSFETHVLVLKDFGISGGRPAPYSSPMDFMLGKIGPVVTVNGQVDPRIDARPGSVQRWRLLNASTARFYRLALERHELWVIGTDGGLLDKPYAVRELLLSPGERADVLVKVAKTNATCRLLALPYSRGSMMGGMMGGGMMGGGATPQANILTLRSSGRGAGMSLPAVIDPAARRVDPQLGAAVRRSFVLGMGMGGMGMGGMAVQGTINGQSFDVDPLVCTLSAPRLRRSVGTLDDRQPHGHGPSLAPAHQPRPGGVDQRRRCGIRRPVHAGAGLEGHGHRAARRQRDATCPHQRLARHGHVPLPHRGARGHRHARAVGDRLMMSWNGDGVWGQPPVWGVGGWLLFFGLLLLGAAVVLLVSYVVRAGAARRRTGSSRAAAR